MPNLGNLNSKQNKLLDKLGKSEVTLLAFPATAYTEKTESMGMIEEMSLMFEGKGQFRDFETLHGEFAPKNVFGTEQLPFTLVFGTEAYVVFVPDLMKPNEFEAFNEGVKREGLKLLSIRALKTAKAWTYQLLPNKA